MADSAETVGGERVRAGEVARRRGRPPQRATYSCPTHTFKQKSLRAFPRELMFLPCKFQYKTYSIYDLFYFVRCGLLKFESYSLYMYNSLPWKISKTCYKIPVKV